MLVALAWALDSSCGLVRRSKSEREASMTAPRVEGACFVRRLPVGVGIGPATFLPHAAPQPKEAKIPHFRLHSRRASRPRNLLAVTFQPPTRVRAPDEDEKERNWLGECPGKSAGYGSDEIYLRSVSSLWSSEIWTSLEFGCCIGSWRHPLPFRDSIHPGLEHPFVSRTSDTGAGTGTDAVPTPTDSPVDNGKRGTQRVARCGGEPTGRGR